MPGRRGKISGTVLDYPDDYDSYCRLRIRIRSDDLPHFKAIVYDNKEAYPEAEPGDTVSFTAKISTGDTLYGKPYDNYNVNGYYLQAQHQGRRGASKGRLYPAHAAGAAAPLPLRAGGPDLSGGQPRFLKALMLGDKQDFYDDDALYVTMSRSGLMHVVAVSGLHISFLVGLLTFLLGNGRARLISIVLIWCFVLVTGAGNSALRAAFMQTLLLLAPVLRRENDPVTSLSTVLALILAACPLAAKSVSLQLSFAAMAGILCFGESSMHGFCAICRSELQLPVRCAMSAASASSLSVMVFTTPLTALHFSYVPLLAVLSNIACLWAVSVCFCMAWAACLLSVIPALGTAAAWLCAWLVRYILFAREGSRHALCGPVSKPKGRFSGCC